MLVIAFVRVNKGSAGRNKMVVIKGITVKASICNLCYTVDSLVDFILLKVDFKCHIQRISCIITGIIFTDQPSNKLTELRGEKHGMEIRNEDC